jgi:hypothetical protein
MDRRFKGWHQIRSVELSSSHTRHVVKVEFNMALCNGSAH